MNPVQTGVLTLVRVNTIQTEKGRAEGRSSGRGGMSESGNSYEEEVVTVMQQSRGEWHWRGSGAAMNEESLLCEREEEREHDVREKIK